MKNSVELLVVMLSGVVGTAPAKTKKDPVVPKLFCQARFVYVETADGNVLDPNVLDPNVVAADRDVALALEEHLREWKRYTLVLRRDEADLVWVVRTGRLVSAGMDTGHPTDSRVTARIGAGSGPTGTPNPETNGQDPGDVGSGRSMPGAVSAQVGDPDDLLTIFEGAGDGGTLHTWLWKKSEAGGLLDAGMPLFQQVRDAVDAACV